MMMVHLSYKFHLFYFIYLHLANALGLLSEFIINVSVIHAIGTKKGIPCKLLAVYTVQNKSINQKHITLCHESWV